MDKRKSTGARTEPLRSSEGGGSAAGTTPGAQAASPSTTAYPDITAGAARPQSAQGQHDGGSARGVIHTVQRKAAEQLASQKGRATDGLDAIASAVRQTSGQLRNERHDTMAQFIERGADGLERLSGVLKSKDAAEWLHDAQRLARRQPALFIGGSFALGLLAARFLKSSPSAASTRHETEAY